MLQSEHLWIKTNIKIVWCDLMANAGTILLQNIHAEIKFIIFALSGYLTTPTNFTNVSPYGKIPLIFKIFRCKLLTCEKNFLFIRHPPPQFFCKCQNLKMIKMYTGVGGLSSVKVICDHYRVVYSIYFKLQFIFKAYLSTPAHFQQVPFLQKTAVYKTMLGSGTHHEILE